MNAFKHEKQRKNELNRLHKMQKLYHLWNDESSFARCVCRRPHDCVLRRAAQWKFRVPFTTEQWKWCGKTFNIRKWRFCVGDEKNEWKTLNFEDPMGTKNMIVVTQPQKVMGRIAVIFIFFVLDSSWLLTIRQRGGEKLRKMTNEAPHESMQMMKSHKANRTQLSECNGNSRI